MTTNDVFNYNIFRTVNLECYSICFERAIIISKCFLECFCSIIDN